MTDLSDYHIKLFIDNSRRSQEAKKTFMNLGVNLKVIRASGYNVPFASFGATLFPWYGGMNLLLESLRLIKEEREGKVVDIGRPEIIVQDKEKIGQIVLLDSI